MTFVQWGGESTAGPDDGVATKKMMKEEGKKRGKK